MTLLLWTTATLCIGLFVHLVSVLALPLGATRDAPSRLADLPPNVVRPLPRAGPGAAVLPFGDPAVATAVCRFDLGEAPLRLTAQTGDAPLSLTFVEPGGRVFYALTDRAAVRGTIDVRLVTAEQRIAIEAEDAEDEAIRELRLTVPRPRGLVVIRALAPTPGAMARAEALAAAAECRPEPLEK